MTVPKTASPYPALSADRTTAHLAERAKLLAVDRLFVTYGPVGVRMLVDDEGRFWAQAVDQSTSYLYAVRWGQSTPVDQALLRVSQGKWIVTNSGQILSARSGHNLGTPNSDGYLTVKVRVPGRGSRPWRCTESSISTSTARSRPD